MDIISPDLEHYITQHSENEPELLAALHKETYQKVLNPRMLSGHFQGRVLSLLSKITVPKTILEIGTYTGYATLCLAEGLAEDGILDTIDNNEELVAFQKKYFNASPYKNKIHQFLGNAIDIIPTLNRTYDLVFIDADKPNYCNYFHLIISKMNRGGIIVSDNILCSGKVLQKEDVKDKSTSTLLVYNQLLKEDPRVETVILPIRDGLTISRVV